MGRALEPNAFYEPAFALSAARHFAVKSRPLFLAVWSPPTNGEEGRLICLCPITPPANLLGDGLAHAWLHKQAALSTPLLDRKHAVAALEALLAWFESDLSGVSGFVFSRIAQDGPTFAALKAAALATGRRLRILDSFERAVLSHGQSADEAFRRAGNSKTLPELRRRRRRLDEFGHVEHKRLSSPDEVRRGTEEFLTLEASGWKRGKGALLSEPSLTTFIRSATRLLAREGKCQIHKLTLDGRPIAMGIVLESAGRSYFWKIAFDEELRSQAPGVELAYEVTKAQTERNDLDLTNSCAIPNHPMINRIWPDRIRICDVVVQTRVERLQSFTNACRTESARRSIRDLAKRAAIRLTKRKVS